MTRRMILCAMALTGAALAAQKAQAQTGTCAPHEVIVDWLASEWGESRQSIALGAGNSLVEVFAAPETGTWTITVTRPDGPTCLVASGEAYQPVTDALPGTDDGA